jgi:hypothetical protein
VLGIEARKLKFSAADALKVPKALKDLQRFIQLLQESFEAVYPPAERTPVRFLHFLKAFRQIYSLKLAKDEAVKKFDPKNTMEAAQSPVKPELLEEAKVIIEAIPKLNDINEHKRPPN